MTENENNVFDPAGQDPSVSQAVMDTAAETETTLSGTDPVGFQEEPTPGKKNTKTMIIIIAVVAVLALAVIVGFASGLLGKKDPKTAVLDAFTATSAQSSKLMDNMYQENPVAKLMLAPTSASKKTDYTITLHSLSGFEGDQMVNQLISGAYLKGYFTNDLENSATEIYGELGLSQIDLISLYAFASPDLVAFNLPSISDTKLSVNMQTLAQDIEASPVFKDAISAEDLTLLQDSISSYFSGLGALDSQSFTAEMEAKMKELTDSLLANATFEGGDKVDDLRVYTVTIPGEDVRAFINELCRYLYIDSEFAKVYESAISPMLLNMEVPYEQFMEENILSQVDRMIPEMATVLTLGVGKGDIIKNFALTATALEDVTGTVDAPVFQEISMDGVMDGLNETVNMSMELSADEEAFVVDVSAATSYADKAYTMDMDMGVTVGGTQVTYTLGMTADGAKETDNTQFTAFMGIKDNESNMDMTLDLGCTGTVSVSEEKTVVDLNDINADITVDQETISLNMGVKTESAALEAPLAFQGEHKELLKMTQEELAEVETEYYDGFMELVNRVLPFVLGEGVSAPVPEEPASPMPAEPAA